MRYLYIILAICFFSCTDGTKRDFFQSVKVENHFLDTFSLSDLKSFGISNKSTLKNGRAYYDFNSLSNAIYTNGFFSKDKGKIFFLPEKSEQELLLLDTSLWNAPAQILPQKLSTKSQTVYEITRLELVYNENFKDSVLSVEMRMSNILNRTETLIFNITKGLDILAIEHVDCKNDTLIMKFFPKQEVYFKYINKSGRCL
ncbi:MAG: hypothetical protein WCK60_03550 [Candidatus Nomurabacteria bacterium]